MNQATNGQQSKPEPLPPLRKHQEWVDIRCPRGHLLCQAAPGSIVKAFCRKCKELYTVIAA